jgi:hypothetical protein
VYVCVSVCVCLSVRVCVCMYARECVLNRAVPVTVHIHIGPLMYHRFQNCAVPVYYAASTGNSLRAFRNNLSVPPSKVKNPRRKSLICQID